MSEMNDIETAAYSRGYLHGVRGGLAASQLVLNALNAKLDEYREALKLLAARQCGSGCTVKDKDGKERYPNVNDRCAACVAALALGQPAPQPTKESL